MDYLEARELYHHGIKGQKWGIRRYQNTDGSLTSLGKKRYGADDAGKMTEKGRETYESDLKKDKIRKTVKGISLAATVTGILGKIGGRVISKKMSEKDPKAAKIAKKISDWSATGLLAIGLSGNAIVRKINKAQKSDE